MTFTRIFATRIVSILLAVLVPCLVSLVGIAAAETGSGFSPLFTLDTNDYTGVGEVPTAFHLSQVYPNPFNPSTTINYDLPQTSVVHLTVFDLKGRVVRKLRDGVSESAGSRHAIWNGYNDQGRQVSSGVYVYRLRAGSFIAMKSMTLVK